MRTGIIHRRIEDPDVVVSCDEHHEATDENMHHPLIIEDPDVVVSCDGRH